MYKFIPSYVGSKKYWISYLEKYKGENFVELFAGSAILSANLAKSSILFDIDPKVCQILFEFDKQIVPEIFTQEDYFLNRPKEDWWRYAYCFQKMSFSGVFRYSKNGYNVPIKKNIKEIRVKNEYLVDLNRWKELKPEVVNANYFEIDPLKLENKILVLDPPYQGSQASYNSGNNFDYDKYWDFVFKTKDIVKTLIIFDRKSNLESKAIPVLALRKMRVNGARDGDLEGIGIFENGEWKSGL
jgi:site-specific DNA-adenine methylase